MSHAYSLRSEFDLPANAPSKKTHSANDLTIAVTSPCMGRNAKVCADVEAALLFGAVPAAQAVMHRRVNEANRDALPLACTLSFGS